MRILLILLFVINSHLLLSATSQTTVKDGSGAGSSTGSGTSSGMVIVNTNVRTKSIDEITNSAVDRLTKNGYFTTGRFESGKIDKGASAYVTLTLYKDVEYGLVIGSGAGAEEIEVSIFNESLTEIVEKREIKGAGFTLFNVKPSKTVHYYMKIKYDKGKTENTDWFYMYGFKSK